MNSVVLLAVSIIIAAIIIVVGLGYFTANPSVLKTTSISSTSIT
jgi:FlaG/FlaF family flagellin (archaellin)